MKKSVYSLVLADEVVDAIDQLAYSMNTSRSNLINQILAERVSLSTPEMRMKDMFQSIQALMDDTFQILDQSSDSMFSLRSQLKYKYKPTIRYSLELTGGSGNSVGRLKIAFRTQSQALVEALNGFFIVWNSLEQHYIGRFFPEDPGIQTDGTRYIRQLHLPPKQEHQNDEVLSRAIAAYIQMLDSMIKLYFANLSLPEASRNALLETRYREYLSDPGFVTI